MQAKHEIPTEYLQGFAKAGGSLLNDFVNRYGLQGQRSEAAVRSPLEQFAKSQDIGARHVRQMFALWVSLATGTPLAGVGPEAEQQQGDRRFSAKAWQDNPLFELIKQSYLLNSRLVEEWVEAADVDEKTRQKLRFFSRQLVDAASPANFALSNPDAITSAIESNGQTFVAGFRNLVSDLGKGKVSITDESAFEVGRNVAVSPGAVVFENELFQLIQYSPLKDNVAARPLLIVPPCINKFYILDLQPQNSFVRFAGESGLTVFVVSWRSASKALERTTWDDYVELGAIKAVEVALAISGADKLNAVGWCVGGTILSSALAVMRVKGTRNVASLTLLTTMLDFADPGELGVFIDEQGVSAREQAIGEHGIYPGKELAFVFQTLRANDLIWPYVVNNYLKGKSPDAFDLLYWNADSTNLPGPMYCWYLRNMYLENNLRNPDTLSMCGVPVDLGRIDMPSYVLATQEDHIVPWRSAYRSVHLLGGKSIFVLGASGHIAGVINPASKNRRSHWIEGEQVENADAWLASAREVPGSWWIHWMSWLKPFTGRQRAAPLELGAKGYPPIEPAPGRYVKERSA